MGIDIILNHDGDGRTLFIVNRSHVGTFLFSIPSPDNVSRTVQLEIVPKPVESVVSDVVSANIYMAKDWIALCSLISTDVLIDAFQYRIVDFSVAINVDDTPSIVSRKLAEAYTDFLHNTDALRKANDNREIQLKQLANNWENEKAQLRADYRDKFQHRYNEHMKKVAAIKAARLPTGDTDD